MDPNTDEFDQYMLNREFSVVSDISDQDLYRGCEILLRMLCSSFLLVGHCFLFWERPCVVYLHDDFGLGFISTEDSRSEIKKLLGSSVDLYEVPSSERS